MAGIGWGTATRGITRATRLIESLVEGAPAYRQQTKTVLGAPGFDIQPSSPSRKSFQRQAVCRDGEVFAADLSDPCKLFLVFWAITGDTAGVRLFLFIARKIVG
jgi:hypothetical protein